MSPRIWAARYSSPHSFANRGGRECPIPTPTAVCCALSGIVLRPRIMLASPEQSLFVIIHFTLDTFQLFERSRTDVVIPVLEKQRQVDQKSKASLGSIGRHWGQGE